MKGEVEITREGGIQGKRDYETVERTKEMVEWKEKEYEE